MNSRRQFLKLAGSGVLAAGISPVIGAPSGQPEYTDAFGSAEDLFKLGIAGYTFVRVPVDTAISIMKRVGIWMVFLNPSLGHRIKLKVWFFQ